MNTDTGNIFAITNDEALKSNEIALTAEQFKELFPVRDLRERLDIYKQMTEQMKPTEFQTGTDHQ